MSRSRAEPRLRLRKQGGRPRLAGLAREARRAPTQEARGPARTISMSPLASIGSQRLVYIAILILAIHLRTSMVNLSLIPESHDSHTQQVGIFGNTAPSSSRWPINSSWPLTALTHSIILTKEKEWWNRG
jgi:hypothetical protein